MQPLPRALLGPSPEGRDRSHLPASGEGRRVCSSMAARSSRYKLCWSNFTAVPSVRIKSFLFIALALVFGVAASAAPIALRRAVEVTRPVELFVPTSRLVLDRNGRLLRPYPVEDGLWRLPATVAEVDPLYISMLVAIEDRRFRAHSGVDAAAVVRAGLQLVTNGRIVSGASTLTMQVVRLAERRHTRSPTGKAGQIVGALALERFASKDQILAAYLTLAPFGGNIEGVRAAALAWFGKEPRRLSPAEAALLVALPQSPEARRPDRHPEAARLARDRVLRRAVAAGLLDEADAARAMADPVPTGRRAFPVLAAHLADRAVAAEAGSGTIRLTIDGNLQERIESLAAERARALGDRISVAILVADHATGDVLASVGSAGLFDEARDGHVDMTRAIRSPGSTLKPFIYGLAFEQGLARPETLVEDRPTAFAGYQPRNFDKTFHGTGNGPPRAGAVAQRPRRPGARGRRSGEAGVAPAPRRGRAEAAGRDAGRPRGRPWRRRRHAGGPYHALRRARPRRPARYRCASAIRRSGRRNR